MRRSLLPNPTRRLVKRRGPVSFRFWPEKGECGWWPRFDEQREVNLHFTVDFDKPPSRHISDCWPKGPGASTADTPVIVEAGRREGLHLGAIARSGVDRSLSFQEIGHCEGGKSGQRASTRRKPASNGDLALGLRPGRCRLARPLITKTNRRAVRTERQSTPSCSKQGKPSLRAGG